MGHFDDDLRCDFDRLADGELTLDGERRLIAALDAQPATWRSCALALLEERALRKEFSELRDGELATGRHAAQNVRPFGSWVGICLAAAAALVVSFSLGWAIAAARIEGESPSANGRLASGDVPPGERLHTAPGLASIADSDSRWQSAIINFAGGRGQIDLPFSSRTTLDSSWLVTDGSAISSETVRELERTGFQVKESGHSVWPIQLSDGRQLIVPIEEVEVQYVGLNYQ